MNRTTKSILRPLIWPFFRVVRFAYGIWLRNTRATDVEGFRLIDVARGDVQERVEKVRAAVELIREHQPHRLAQCRRYIPHLVVSYTGGSGEYWMGLNVCVLDADYLRNVDATLIAMLLLHESTHGRLDRWRIPTTKENIHRVEALCSSIEIDFARRLPDGSAYIESVGKSLEQQWWGAENEAARQLRRLRAAGWL